MNDPINDAMNAIVYFLDVLHKSGIKSLLDENNYTDISLDQPEGSANNVNILLKENVGKWTFG